MTAVIDLGPCLPGQEFLVGRDSHCTFVIDHHSVSREHAALTIDDGGRIGVRDLASTFGVKVNKAAVISRQLNEGDLVQFGGHSLYRVKGRRLEADPEAVGMAVRFDALSVARGGQAILVDVTAEIGSDEFVGVIGPSGCGKSTLLACLTGAYPPSSGKITYDQTHNLSEQLPQFLQRTGVVPQNDLVFAELSVDENLLFSARIKEPELPQAELRHRISAALEAVALTEHRSKRASDLSGGQRKRVNVAIELLTKPRLLLLDEPTSGLDPQMELSLLDKLRSLTRRGMTVVCVAHTSNLHLFDKVIRLQAQTGRDSPLRSVLYCGPPQEMANVPAASHDSHAGHVAAEGTRQATGTGIRLPPVAIRRPKSDKRFFVSQALTVFLRTLQCAVRDRAACGLFAATPVIFALIITLSQKERNGPTYMCFFFAISAFWLGMTVSIREIVREQRLYVRDKLAGLIPTAYLAGKIAYAGVAMVCQAGILLVSGVITFRIVRYVSPQAHPIHLVYYNTSVSSLILGFIPLCLCAISGSLAGLMISTVAKTERMAVSALPLVLLPQILLSQVGYGDADDYLGKPPFGLIASAPGTVKGTGTVVDWLLYLGSSGFATRPTSTLMTLACSAPGQSSAAAFVEVLYIVGLLTLYAIATLIVFIEFEKHRTDWR